MRGGGEGGEEITGTGWEKRRQGEEGEEGWREGERETERERDRERERAIIAAAPPTLDHSAAPPTLKQVMIWASSQLYIGHH